MKNRVKVTAEQFRNWIRHVIQSSEDVEQMLSLLKLQDMRGAWSRKDAKEYLIARTGGYSILGRLKNTGLLVESGEYGGTKVYKLQDTIKIREYLRKYRESQRLSTQEAVREYEDVILRLKREYENFVAGVDEEDVEEWCRKIRDVGDIEEYTKRIMGNWLYMDALLPIIQQYSISNVDVFSSANLERKINQTGFSLAYFGEPGTGKTFATDDLLRGKEEKGIPPHGIIGRIRYAQGMTPKMFIAILEAYQDYPVDWVIPEFRDFFAYRGMVEKLKLVMERREVRDETRNVVIGPYKVTSFFVVNYNTQSTRSGWRNTMGDPNFSAVEDRMICKLFLNTSERRRRIWENMKRIASGKVDYSLAPTLRMHITYTYHLLTTKRPKVIMEEEDFTGLGDEIAREIERQSAHVSLRIVDRAIQIASASSLIRYLNERDSQELVVDRKSLSLARQFVMEEIRTRSMEA